MRTNTNVVRRGSQVEYYSQQLSDAQRRLAELHEQGARALSRYDVEIAHQGDAGEALLTAKRLLGNQIKYIQRRIAELKKGSEQLVLL